MVAFVCATVEDCPCEYPVKLFTGVFIIVDNMS